MSSHDDQATTTTTDDMIISPIPTVGNLIHGNASVLLAISQDTDWGLSDLDILVRNNLEVFQASEDDVLSAHLDGKFPIKCGQIGVRCIHCARNNVEGARRGAVMYPYSLNSLFESTRILQIMHLEQCSHVPDDLKKKISSSFFAKCTRNERCVPTRHEVSFELAAEWIRTYISSGEGVGSLENK